MASNYSPIGIFDSGVGGLSVARQLYKQLPNETLNYYADTAHVPYGGRELSEIQGYAVNICDFLVAKGAKMLVMACNISSAVAIDLAKQQHPNIPVIGVVRPGAWAAVKTGAERIGVLATQGTVTSEAYVHAIRSADKAIRVIQVPCPKFVPLVESDQCDNDAAYDACIEYLKPLASQQCDAIILGCTHYPFLLTTLQKAASSLFDQMPVFVDPAGETARLVGATLDELGLSNPDGSSKTYHRYFVSGNVASFERHAPLFLQASIVGAEPAV